MNYEITFERHTDYIHARITGSNSPDTVVQYMTDVHNECKRQDCFRLLIEENLEGPRLDVGEIFTLMSEGSMSALGLFDALAYVDPAMGELADFAETVGVNRGMPILMFQTVDDARAWLETQHNGNDAQHIFTRTT